MEHGVDPLSWFGVKFSKNVLAITFEIENICLIIR